MIRTALVVALIALPLAACGDGKQGTTITFNSSDADGNTTGVIDGTTGKVAINAPGFSGALSLPKIHIDSNDFNMNGVHLYPGSTVSGMNVNAQGNGKGGDGDGNVTVNFSSPAKPDTVQAWFLDKLNHAGFDVKSDGTGISGMTDDKKPFRLDLSPDGADKAKGVITMG
jgi:hypothetical protein